MNPKPLTKACLYALAVMEHGRQAWGWGLWMHPRHGLQIKPGGPR